MGGISRRDAQPPRVCVRGRERELAGCPPPHEGRWSRVRVPTRTRAHARRGGPHPLYECVCATIFRRVWEVGLTVGLCFRVLGWWGPISWHSRSLPPGAGVSRWLWLTCSSRSCVVQVALSAGGASGLAEIWGSAPPPLIRVRRRVPGLGTELTLADATTPEWGGAVCSTAWLALEAAPALVVSRGWRVSGYRLRGQR